MDGHRFAQPPSDDSSGGDEPEAPHKKKPTEDCAGIWSKGIGGCGDTSTTLAQGEFGSTLAISGTRVTPLGGAADGRFPSGLVAMNTRFYVSEQDVTGLIGLWYSLGGGSGGLEGGMGYDLMFGWPFGVTPNSAVVLRLGSRGELLGNDTFYNSMLEIPAVMLGYQFMNKSILFEAGVRSGVNATGRANAAPYRNKLDGGLDGAVYAGMHTHGVHVELELDELSAVGLHSTPAQLAKAHLCIGGKLTFCFDGRMSQTTFPGYVAAGVPTPGATIFYGGVSFGAMLDNPNDW